MRVEDPNTRFCTPKGGFRGFFKRKVCSVESKKKIMIKDFQRGSSLVDR